MAIHSISITEITQTTGVDRVEDLMVGLNEATASRKVVSILFLSLEPAVWKKVLDKFEYSIRDSTTHRIIGYVWIHL